MNGTLAYSHPTRTGQEPARPAAPTGIVDHAGGASTGGRAAADNEAYARQLESMLPCVRRVTMITAARARMPPDDRDELLSVVLLKLVADDYAVLRAFKGRCQMSTYLTVVIRRVALDLQVSRWGKWRPSAQVRREGPVAVTVDSLMQRKGLSFDEACQRVEGGGSVRLDLADRGRLRAVLGQRRRRHFVSLDEVGEPAGTESGPLRDRECRSASKRASRALQDALAHLGHDDRVVLALRFREGLPVPSIAQLLQEEEKPLYRRISHLLRRLRRSLEQAGLDRETVSDSIGHATSEPWPLLAMVSCRRLQALGVSGHVGLD